MNLPAIRRRHLPLSWSPERWPSLSPVLARVLAHRGLDSPEQIRFSLNQLPPPDTMPGIADAVALLRQARQRQARILVVGDYDTDGATATALMLKGLRLLGFATPGFLVPDRFTYGYGLSPGIVELAVREAQPDLIITVDNGIASHEGVAAAQAQGIQVLITDHHLPADTLPSAEAIVNPRLDAASPFLNLAGVGVAFYTLLALRGALRDAGELADDGNLLSLLDLVALGTVADVVALDAVNRILVEQGLRRMRAGQVSPGIAAILAVAGRNPERLRAMDLGFAVAPRLNAAGRLADMSRGIRCLLAEDEQAARQLAEELDAINRERQVIEHGMREEALREIARLEQAQALPCGVSLFDDGWHEGVVGILAARVKERLHRPVIAFAPSQEAGLIKGSGRSIKGIHLRDVLDAIAKRYPQLLHRFGGHAMAAGLTLRKADLPVFRQAFDEEVLRWADASVLERVIETDGELAEPELSLATAELLQFACPWGQGFPNPLFDGEFEVLNVRWLSDKHLKLTLGLPKRSALIDGIWFNAPRELAETSIQRVRGAYQLSVNEYQGRRSAQLIFEHLEPI